ncbi:MAG: TRAP transporter small permease [Synergistaceae bacterium]|jgi:TRAP-type C4-dicarboxylate transport system permease small subunit|nr:TRAP transporter small permease [Synergistaceae bacterium]
MLTKAFDYLEESLIVLGVAFMTIMNFTNVVSRYCFTNSFSFTEEITIMTFVWVSMLGIAAGFKRMSHLGMNYFVEKLPAKMQAPMMLLSMFCSLAMISVMIYEGIEMVDGQIMLGAKTPALHLPLAAQGLAIPVGGLFIAVRILIAGWTEFKRLSAGSKSPEAGGTPTC